MSCVISERPEIVQGSDRILKLTIRDKNGDPYDLTSNTEITAKFTKTDGSDLEVTKTGGAVTIIGNELLGKIQVSLTDTQTAEIEAGIKIDFVVIIDKGTDRKICRFNQQIDVVTP
jgi:hypothetical protein